MAKITISDILGQFASVIGINSRFQQLEDELNEKVLYRDNPGTEPNEMNNALDMSNNPILNLPNPTDPTSPVRVQDILDGDAVADHGNLIGLLDDDHPQYFMSGRTIDGGTVTDGTDSDQIQVALNRRPVELPSVADLYGNDWSRYSSLSTQAFQAGSSIGGETWYRGASGGTQTTVGTLYADLAQGYVVDAGGNFWHIVTNTGRINSSSFGVVADGVTDDAPAANAFLDFLSLNALAGEFQEGTILLQAGMEIDSNTDIVCSKNTVFLRDFAESGTNQGKYVVGDPTLGTKDLTIGPDPVTEAAWQASTAYSVGDKVNNARGIFQCVIAGTSDSSGGPDSRARYIEDNTCYWEYLYSTKTQRPVYTNIKWKGGTFKAKDSSAIGPHVVLTRIGDSVIEIDNFDTVYGDYNFSISGHSNSVKIHNMDGGYDGDEDGVHLFGGENNTVIVGTVRSGDDACVMGNSHDIDVYDNSIYAGSAHSAVAWIAKLSHGTSALYPSADHRIENNHITVESGSGSKGGAAIWDDKAGGYVTNNSITIKSAELVTPESAVQGYGAWVLDAPDNRVQVYCEGAYRSALKADNSSGLTAIVDSGSNRASNNKIVDVDNCDNLTLTVNLVGNDDHVVDIQNSDNIVVKGDIIDIPDTKGGVFLANVDGFILGVRCVQASGASGIGYLIQGTCSNGVILSETVVPGVDTPISYTSGIPTYMRFQPCIGADFASHNYTDANVGIGTTAGYARINANIYFRAGEERRYEANADDVWDLTGVSTAVGEYKHVLLCFDDGGTARIVEGEAGANINEAKLPGRAHNYCVIGIVEIPPSYAGGSLAGFVFLDVVGNFGL
jgi:hypothetical protein